MTHPLAASALAFALLGVTPPVTAQDVPSSEVADVAGLLDAGDRQMQAQSWTSAVAAYERAVDVAPTRADAWFRLGVALAVTGQLRRADQALERAHDLAPELPGIGEIRGQLAARISAEASLALDRPGYESEPDVRELARLDAARSGDWLLAARAALTLDPMTPTEAEAYLARDRGELAQAAVWAAQALGEQPQALALYLLCADIERLGGDREAAQHYLELYDAFGGDPDVAHELRTAISPSAHP